MARYTEPIAATRINLIHFTERPTATKYAECARCATRVQSPRPGGMCRSCRDVVNFEKSCERLGVDLASLADDEYVVIKKLGGGRKGKCTTVAVIMKDEVAA